MKSYSLFKQPIYSPSGKELRINLNHKSETVETEYGEETHWECVQLVLSLGISREELIEQVNIIDPEQAVAVADGWEQYKETKQ